MNLYLILALLAGVVLLRSLFFPAIVGGVLGVGAVALGPQLNFPVDERLAFAMLAGGFALGILNTLGKAFAGKDDKDKKKKK